MTIFDIAKIVFILLIFLAGIIWGISCNKKRKKEWNEFARRHGFTLSFKDTNNLPEFYSNFYQFSIGHNKKAEYICRGKVGDIDICCFDYSYKIGKSNNSITVLITSSKTSYKTLDIRPEKFIDKIGAAVGLNDIDFESAEFSKKYYVQSVDRKFAYDIISPRMMEFLLTCHPTYIEMCSNQILFHRKTPLFFTNNPNFIHYNLETLLEEMKRFYALIPAYINKDAGAIKVAKEP